VDFRGRVRKEGAVSSQVEAHGQGEGKDKVIHYQVNGEPQETTEHKLTVRQILEDAGFKPGVDYQLTRDNGHHTYANLDEEVPLHDGETFTATFTGPTPTS
jgi:hypothetical protein